MRISELADEQRELNEIQKNLNRLTTEKIVQDALLTQQTQKLRQQTLLQRVEFEKICSCFKETNNPIFTKIFRVCSVTKRRRRRIDEIQNQDYKTAKIE